MLDRLAIFILDLWKNWSILAKNLIFMVLAIRPNRNFMLLSLEFRLTSYVMNLPYGVFHILQNQFFCISWTPHYTPCTLKSGIVVLVGINVLVGTFVKINKHTGGNKRTGGNFCQREYRNKLLLKPEPYKSFHFRS